jgi:hypothetical protein
VVEWLDGDEGRRVVDELATRYTRQPYQCDQERVVAWVDVEQQKIGPESERRSRRDHDHDRDRRADPCVRTRMILCEVLACHGFPGDALP